MELAGCFNSTKTSFMPKKRQILISYVMQNVQGRGSPEPGLGTTVFEQFLLRGV